MPVLGTVIPGEVVGVGLLIDITSDDGVQPAVRAARTLNGGKAQAGEEAQQ